MENKDAFLLEQYKYVLSQKGSLNDGTFKIATIYQGALGLIFAGQFALVVAFKGRNIDPELARAGTLALFGLLVITSLFSLSLLASGVASWIDYRREEGELEEMVLGSRRRASSISSVFSWYETYFALFVVLVLSCYVIFVFFYLYPRFHG